MEEEYPCAKTLLAAYNAIDRLSYALPLWVLRMVNRRLALHKQHFRASIDLVKLCQQDIKFTVSKMTAAQAVYLSRNADLYTPEEVGYVQYYLDTLLFKSQLAYFGLEQLWEVREAIVDANILDIFSNSVTSIQLTNSEEFFQAYVLEQFLYQSRSYLDIFMLYLAHILRTGHRHSMSVDKFYSVMPKANPDVLSNKSTLVVQYFRENVFSSENKVTFAITPNWGELLRSLRDKIAHRDRIKISNNSRDRIMHDILLDIPTLKDMTYEKFCQTIENGMYELIRDLFPILYDLEWQAGPYREGMFET